MAEPRPLQSNADLREIVADAAELAKGVRSLDDGGLLHLARYEKRLFCDATGASAAPYKVSVTLDDTKVTARCTCFAARSRPFCKHAAGLLVAWARTPEAFAVATESPGGDAKPKQVKRGKIDATSLLAKGVEQVLALTGELGVSGAATLGEDRAAGVRALAEALRENRLRRLSARTLEIADLLDDATAGRRVDAIAWADRISDLLLSARRVQKHIDGDTLDDRYVEELIGKTWTKKDRTPITGLDLVEISHRQHETPDDFLITESRFVDIKTGDHYTEKQILPAFLAKRTEPKRSHAGLVLKDAAGTLYPGFAPRRLTLQDAAEGGAAGSRITDDVTLGQLRDVCLASVGDALAALQERRKDLFAPDLVPVAVRAHTIFARGARLELVDERGEALFFPPAPVLARRLAGLLGSVKLLAVFGDVGIHGALPTLFPLSFLVDDNGRLTLRPLVGGDVETVRASTAAAAPWVETARAAGVSPVAVALGETREELAEALFAGLAGFTPRTADALAARLTDVGLAKPGAVLVEAAKKTDARARLDDVVRVHQVTGVALVRLAGAVAVEAGALTPVPTLESVQVRAPNETLAPQEIATRTASAKLNRFEAAVLYARWYDGRPPQELLAHVDTWADGAASLFVAAALGRAAQAQAAAAVDVARRVLRERSMVARITAIRVLQGVVKATDDDGARALLSTVALEGTTPLYGWAAHALRALGLPVPERDDAVAEQQRSTMRRALRGAPRADARATAAAALVSAADIDGIPDLRAALEGDAAVTVRRAAAAALGSLGDVESFDRFLEMLAEPERADDVKTAMRALGALGDARAVTLLAAAYAEGNHPVPALEALAMTGGVGVRALVQLVDDDMTLARRQAVQTALASLPAEQLAPMIEERLARVPVAETDALIERAAVWWTAADASPAAQKLLAEGLRARLAALDTATQPLSKAARALQQKCAIALGEAAKATKKTVRRAKG